MAKQSGLGDNLFFDGYDLSSDIQSIGLIGMPTGQLDVTAIDKSAMERINGLADGEISFVAFFNPAALRAHAALSPMPTTDIQVMYMRGTTRGNPSAAQIAKEINYAPTRAADGSLLQAVQTLADEFPVEWGKQLTAGKDNSTGVEDTTGVDDGTTGETVVITSSSVDNPTNILCAAVHGLTTGDSVIIAGHAGSTPAINNTYVVTVVDTLNFTIPENVSVGGTGGTMQKVSQRFGFAAYLQVFAFTGTSTTFTLEESFDNGSTDAYAALTDGAFAAANGRTTERIEASSLTAVVERYIRVALTGTYSTVDYAIMFNRYVGANRET